TRFLTDYDKVLQPDICLQPCATRLAHPHRTLTLCPKLATNEDKPPQVQTPILQTPISVIAVLVGSPARLAKRGLRHSPHGRVEEAPRHGFESRRLLHPELEPESSSFPGPALPRYCVSAALFYCCTPILLYSCTATMLRPPSTTTPPHDPTVPLLHCSIVPLFYCLLFRCSIARPRTPAPPVFPMNR